MKIFSRLSPTLRRNLLILFTAGLLFWSSLASLLGTLPLYIKQVGGSNHEIGIVMGAFAIGLLAFRPWLGRLADRQGRQLVMVIGLSVSAIAPLGYLLTPTIPGLIVVRIFHGISIAAFTTAYSALIVDLSPPENRGEVLGYMSLVNPVGVALGPALGGFLQEAAGYGPLFFMSAALGAVGLACNLQVKVPSVPSDPSHASETLAADTTNAPFWQLLLSPRLRIPTLTMLLIGLAFGILSTFVPLFIKESNVALNPGLFYTAAAIASFSVRLLTGRASDRYGRGRFISLSLALYALAMILLWNAHSAVAFLIAGLAEGSGSGIFIPMTIALIADRCHPQERGQIFGLCMAGFDMGIAIAGPSLGFVADFAGYRGLFSLAAGLACLAFVVFVTTSSKNLVYSLRFALGHGKDVYAIDT